MQTVQSLVVLSSKVIVFVYNNNKVTLNWLQKREGRREIARPYATRFTATFIALQSLHLHTDDLEAWLLLSSLRSF